MCVFRLHYTTTILEKNAVAVKKQISYCMFYKIKKNDCKIGFGERNLIMFHVMSLSLFFR